ncbi:MAG: cation:proton antiporter, partial [Puniceicoccales bacterium]|nr:cation:proton antiporter [Puniceicoccales bacterium]
MEEGTLIQDLATLIATAGTAGIIAHYIRIPLLLSYILSGILLGPHCPFFPSIQDTGTIKELSELGVVLLMFYIGLEFDLRKLSKAIGPAFLAVAFQTIAMIYLGRMLAPILGFDSVSGLFLGGLLCVSSTMIAVSMIRNKNAMDRNYAQLAIGMLILDDMVAILVLVILSGIGMTGYFQWEAVGQVTFLVGVFVTMVFFIGRLLATRIAKILNKINSPELLIVASIGFVLTIAELASKFHFSTELGAFLAGSVFSQSIIAEKVEHMSESLRYVFCSAFFVSIGMLIEPGYLLEHWVLILCITGLILFIMVSVCWFGLFLAGEDAETAFYAATCKSQIGEFSFIIASLGIAYGVTDSHLMSLAVSISIGSIMLSTLLNQNSEKVYRKISHRIPSPIRSLGELYRRLLQRAQIELRQSDLLKILRKPILQTILMFLLLVGLMFVASYISYKVRQMTLPLITEHISLWSVSVWISAAFIAMPVFAGIVRNLRHIISLLFQQLVAKSPLLTRGQQLLKVIEFFISSIALLLFGGAFLSTASPYLPGGFSLLVFLALCSILCAFAWKRLLQINNQVELLFLKSFNQELKDQEKTARQSTLQKIQAQHPWDVEMETFTIPHSSSFIGKSIQNIPVRQLTGVNIVAISRGGYTAYELNPQIILFPNDQLLLLGEKKQLNAAKALFQEKEATAKHAHESLELEHLLVDQHHPLIGKTIGSTLLRE